MPFACAASVSNSTDGSGRTGPERIMDTSASDHERPAAPSLRSAVGYWLRLGCISFGGPAGQIALMHEDLVVRRRWISERRFLHALNFCMVLPGPEAQQLATYLGWLMPRTVGGLVAGCLFALHSRVVGGFVSAPCPLIGEAVSAGAGALVAFP